MKTNVESILDLILDINTIGKTDDLFRIAGCDLYDELSEDDLEMVSAAGAPCYSKFKTLLREKGIE